MMYKYPISMAPVLWSFRELTYIYSRSDSFSIRDTSSTELSDVPPFNMLSSDVSAFLAFPSSQIHYPS